MKLKGRNLKINMTGEDVALLHEKLNKLGFYILPQEIEKKRFGKSTREAVSDIQKRKGLCETGQVDEKTATTINPEVTFRNPFVVDPDSAFSEELADLKRLEVIKRRKAPQLRSSAEFLATGKEGDEVNQLHETLKEVGSSANIEETLTRRFGETTEAAVMEFQEDRGLEPTGTVDVQTSALLNAAVAFRVEGNTPEMRQTLRTAVEENPESPHLAYWLARYEILAGNYQGAREAAALAPDFPRIRDEIQPIFSISARETPEKVHPSNYYTYRHQLVDDDTIRALKNDLKEAVRTKELSQEHLHRAELGDLILDCLFLWNQGSRDLARGRYQSAEARYEQFYWKLLDYFILAYPQIESFMLDRNTLEWKLIGFSLLFIFDNAENFPEVDPNPDLTFILNSFAKRREASTLDELFFCDWVFPSFTLFPGGSIYSRLNLFMGGFSSQGNRQLRFEAPLLVMAVLFVPLSLAEIKKSRRQFKKADNYLKDTISIYEGVVVNSPIESSHVHITRCLLYLDWGDSEYKSGMLAEAEKTYSAILNLVKTRIGEEYVKRVSSGAEALNNSIANVLARPILPLYELGGDAEPPADAPRQRHELQILAKDIPIQTIESTSISLPGLDRQAAPRDQMIKFVPPNGETDFEETNPLIYATVTEAQARLMQIENGINYLGYRDEYVPPWRFRFLLDRARYFAEHARNTQREYLNFLSNAERDELQETTLAQTVEMEKSNVRLETARVEQIRLEVQAAKVSMELADMVATNAEKRFEEYAEFDQNVDVIAGTGVLGKIIGSGLYNLWPSGDGELGEIGSSLFGDFATGVIDFFTGGASSNQINRAIAAMERDLEKFNLQLASQEAKKSADVSKKQLEAVQANLSVSGMLRTTAMLRHEYAVQNLAYSRGQVLNAEAWHRLAGQIRSIAETYMRFAIELAFLTEQAYEFEADKRINVIRFDYDVSEERSLLAADFLLRDLDKIEQDLLITQRQTQQKFRYILSLSREFPEALQELRDHGTTIFSLRLEPLERRFPGIFNMRIASLEVTPVALMDPTRFSLELTNLGFGQVRLRAQPDTPVGVGSPTVLNSNDLNIEEEDMEDSWLSEFTDEWPVKVRVTGPETFVFSGLSQQDRTAAFPFASTSQRNAFEGLSPASAWRIDMSMKENKVVPGSLADVLIAFTLSGYHDSYLRRIVDNARRRKTVPTVWLSAQHSFPDAFYVFNRSGRMDWEVREPLLTINTPIGALRNLAVVLVPHSRHDYFGPFMASYDIEFRVTQFGGLEILTELPEIAGFRTDGLTVFAHAKIPDGGEIFWSFGDDGEFQKQLDDDTALAHTFPRPGRHEFRLRLVKNHSLRDYRGRLVVSRKHELFPPLMPETPFLMIAHNQQTGENHLLGRLNELDSESSSAVWKLNTESQIQRGIGVDFANIQQGTYTLSVTLFRIPKARFYSRQIHLPLEVFKMHRLRVTTHRTFNETTGEETTTEASSALTNHLFEGGAISPADKWSLELLLEDNPFLRSVSHSDVEEIDLSDIGDAVLSLEYENLPN